MKLLLVLPDISFVGGDVLFILPLAKGCPSASHPVFAFLLAICARNVLVFG